MSQGFTEAREYVGGDDGPPVSSSFPNKMLASLACVSGLHETYTIRFGRNFRISERMSLEHPGRAGSRITASTIQSASPSSFELFVSSTSIPSNGPGLVKSRT